MHPTLLVSRGFEIAYQVTVSMQLLEPGKVIEDEGVAGALHFACALMLNSTARQRFLCLKKVFYEDQDYLQGIILIGVKYQ